MVCLIAYSNSFQVPFQFDDFHNILEKPYVRDIRYFANFPGQQWFSGDYGFRMRTVGYFTFALNYWLNGQDVAGYHIVNLFIHLMNGLLLYRFVVLSFRTPALVDTPLKVPRRHLHFSWHSCLSPILSRHRPLRILFSA